ncbi:cytochrome P450 [Oscillatoria sp. CS-180]|uniref:cytochrome P450 n=1 Tax=Oscillatoria sp. CS-180 TaxID=3021720 RepID=UPI00232CAC1F|nr:cytochrome P450 [Oscillatoria sp. CS-180]MDB9524987.1 cytochrome P450 [Oscillatoria sp. CS-180]
MKEIKRLPAIDSTLALAFDGYEFISKRCARYQTDIFQTRITLENTICFRGEEAAKLFYDTNKFSRKDAAPKRVKETLLGEGGVQGLDGEAHRQRKQIFMQLMTPERLTALADLTEQQWRTYARGWENRSHVILFDEVEEILCRAVCEWSGVPLEHKEVAQHTRELSRMISGAGRIGPAHWRAKQARNQAEQWISSVIEKIRTHQLEVPQQTAAYAFACYKNSAGEPMDIHAATVDLLNVLRPTVAIGRYIIFAALALHQHPEERSRIRDGGSDYIHLFTQEVRRFYPFFPFASARTRKEFDWQGYHFPAGIRVLLDLYGTNHDPDLWERPDEFRPERFSRWTENHFDFIPQGGGNYDTNHRCAGEWLTIQLMERSLKFLVNHLTYRVPPQNLDVSLTLIPTLPKSHFRIAEVGLL